MSLHVPKSHTGYIFTIRLIKSTFPPNFPRTQISITTKFNNTHWKTTRSLDSHKIRLQESHTFELTDLSSMLISVSYKSGFFSETEFSSCVVESENFRSRKGIQCCELWNGAHKVQIFWAFVLEEEKKGESLEFLRLINEIEAEREEVKFCKNKTLQKLKQVKGKRRACKEEMNSLIQNFEPILDLCEEKGVVSTPLPRVYNSRTYDPNMDLYMN